MGIYIGTAISKIRKNKGMTQDQLADGICAVRQLFRIEHNQNSPSAFILSELSYRLGNELFDYIPYSTVEEVYELKQTIDELMRLFNHHDHQAVYKMIKTNPILINTKCSHARMELMWLRGSLSHYIEVDVEVSEAYHLDTLRIKYDIDNAFDVFQYNLKPLDFRILNSLVVFYLSKKNDYNLSEQLLLECISSFEKNHNKITDSSYPRFIYNLSRLYLILGKLEDSLFYSKKGIDHLLGNGTIAFLPDLYNLRGRALYKQGYEEEGRECLMNYVNMRKLYKPNFKYNSVIRKLNTNYELGLDLPAID
ncbi:MAG: helix-turn-helix transcriptional regulator [Clostridiales bacterium]|nr:helix-turn-helix transcriptional regulator [Clostridiales bacterium]